MKLLLDENLSRRIIPAIVELYPDSSQVALLGLEGHDDKHLWAYAKQQGYTIVTQDSDFHEMNVLYGFPPKIIWLKCGNQPKRAIIERLTRNHLLIQAFIDDADSGCLEIY